MPADSQLRAAALLLALVLQVLTEGPSHSCLKGHGQQYGSVRQKQLQQCRPICCLLR